MFYSIKKITFLTIIFLLLFLQINFNAYSKTKETNELSDNDYKKYIKEIPIYPNSKIHDLKEKFGMRIKVHVSKDLDIEKIVNFYVSTMKKKNWSVIFPNDEEMKVWLDALNSDRTKPYVITIILNKNKTKINCNLMIGITKDARLEREISIITIYLSSTMLQ